MQNEEDVTCHLDVLKDQTGNNIIGIDFPVGSIDDSDFTTINVLGRVEAASESLLVPSNESKLAKLPGKALHQMTRENITAT